MEQNKLYIKAGDFSRAEPNPARIRQYRGGFGVASRNGDATAICFVVRDVMGNVYMRRDETPDKDHPAAGAYGHGLRKDSGVKHDFNSDPIYLSEEDGKLTAIGTALGADNGVGVALALAAMDSIDELKPVEALFTADEE